MLVSTLSSDYYCNDQSVLLPDVTFEFLRDSASSGFPYFLCFYSASRGNVSILDVVTRGSASNMCT